LCILVQRMSYDVENQTHIRHNTRVTFPIVNFNPNHGLEDIDDGQTYDLIGGIFHRPSGTNTGHYTAVCNINHDSDEWITYDDKNFEQNKFLNSRLTTPTALVKFQQAAYMIFYQRRENVSSSSDSESNHGHGGSGSDDDDRFSINEGSEDNGNNVNNPNESSASSQPAREDTNEQNNDTRPSSVTLNNNNNPTASTSSSQSAEENTNGHNNNSPSPQICPTQRRQVPVREVPFINLTNDTDSDDEDDDEDEEDEADEQYPTCQMCSTEITSDNDVGYIDTGGKCNCNVLKYHTFCLRRYRNNSDNTKTKKACDLHGSEIREFVNIDNEDMCMICQDSLDTQSVWGRFVCHTCPRWYHYDCLESYKTIENSYFWDIDRHRYDMTRLKCILCRKSPRSIERL
jgi:hypothetical protein